jgi:DNA-binding GntR family transcriptional regulator
MVKKVSGVDHIKPIKNENLHQKAYTQLRHAIMSGKFKPGEALSMRGLAAALGTSVMPARDAVLRLIAEQALEAIGRRVQVPKMNVQRLEDVLRFRIALEGEAAFLAAERATPAELAEMRQAGKAVESARSSNKVDRFLAANQSFHFAVYSAAHNALLSSMIETLWLQIGPYLGELTEKSESGDLAALDLSAHDRMVDAIEKGNGKQARAALVSDLNDTVDIFRPFMSSEES